MLGVSARRLHALKNALAHGGRDAVPYLVAFENLEGVEETTASGSVGPDHDVEIIADHVRQNEAEHAGRMGRPRQPPALARERCLRMVSTR